MTVFREAVVGCAGDHCEGAGDGVTVGGNGDTVRGAVTWSVGPEVGRADNNGRVGVTATAAGVGMMGRGLSECFCWEAA